MFKDKILLASQSPRRRELIKVFFKYIQYLTIKTDEPRWAKLEGPLEYLSRCVKFKWKEAFSQEITQDPRTFALVADTIVVLQNEVLGKPLDARDARRMLEKLSGKEHSVFTGLRLGRFSGGEWKFLDEVVESRVTFAKLSVADLKSYIRSGSPMDKAGAYGFQDSGLKFIQKIQGSYTNIVGLPIFTVKKLALELGAVREDT